MYQTLEAEGSFQYDPTLGDLKVMRFSPDTNHDEFNQIQWSVEGKLGGSRSGLHQLVPRPESRSEV